MFTTCSRLEYPLVQLPNAQNALVGRSQNPVPLQDDVSPPERNRSLDAPPNGLMGSEHVLVYKRAPSVPLPLIDHD